MNNDITKIKPDILTALKIKICNSHYDEMVKMRIQKMNLEEEIKQLMDKIKRKYGY